MTIAVSPGATVLDRFCLQSPIGRLVGFVRDGALCALDFDERDQSNRAVLERRFGAIDVREGTGGEPRRRLEAYLSGDLEALDAITVDPGGTAFQAKVWAALRRIRPGRTFSYTELAVAVGSPAAVRAVGTANGQNPVPVVIPCHRVVRSDGTLGGYGGGLDRKRWLLDHEKARLARPAASSAQRPLF
jgi:methylated-DNA-[protein]-cysteine S-methyltransferase